MRYSRVALTVTAAALVLGCNSVLSLRGLFADKDLITDARLPGVWRDGGGDSWAILREDSASTSYLLATVDSFTARILAGLDMRLGILDDSASVRRMHATPQLRARFRRDSLAFMRSLGQPGAPRLFELRLGRLHDSLVADLAPTTADIDGETKESLPTMLPTHWFYRVSIAADSLRLFPLDGSWLKRQIDSNRIQIAHDSIGDGVLLTATTDELRTLVGGLVGDTLAFNPKQAIVLARRVPARVAAVSR